MYKKTRKLRLFYLKITTIILSLALCVSGNILPVDARQAELAYSFGETVYIGGMPIGVTLNLDGLIVIDFPDVATETGALSPAKCAGMKVGDIIIEANGQKTQKTEMLTDIVSKSDNVKLVVKRQCEKITFDVTPAVDCTSKTKKLGLWVRDNTAGIGTMTYMRLDGEFAALGHPIVDTSTGEMIKVRDGKIYHSRIVGVNPGRAGKAGELKGMLKKECGVIGEIAENNKFGIYGKLKKPIENPICMQPVATASRNCVKVGKAQIYTTIEGETPNLYDIEIVKCVKQRRRADKSMVIKVCDKRLLEVAGGIVQGMSGSPIIQNGKLVGAVTHVFVHDPTRGYGVYIDWML